MQTVSLYEIFSEKNKKKYFKLSSAVIFTQHAKHWVSKGMWICPVVMWFYQVMIVLDMKY